MQATCEPAAPPSAPSSGSSRDTRSRCPTISCSDPGFPASTHPGQVVRIAGRTHLPVVRDDPRRRLPEIPIASDAVSRTSSPTVAMNDRSSWATTGCGATPTRLARVAYWTGPWRGVDRSSRTDSTASGRSTTPDSSPSTERAARRKIGVSRTPEFSQASGGSIPESRRAPPSQVRHVGSNRPRPVPALGDRRRQRMDRPRRLVAAGARQDRARHQDPPTHQRPTPEDGDVHAGPVAGAGRTSADHVRGGAGVRGPTAQQAGVSSGHVKTSVRRGGTGVAVERPLRTDADASSECRRGLAAIDEVVRYVETARDDRPRCPSSDMRHAA